MKNILVIVTFITFSLSSTTQEDASRKLIESFIKRINSTKGDVSISYFRENNFLFLSDEYQALEDKTDADAMYSVAIKRFYDFIQCKNDLEILTLEQSKINKGYSRILHIPDDYENEIYILYCDENASLHFLIRDKKIFSFIIIKKGETNIFLTF
jgi:hypothetical protein